MFQKKTNFVGTKSMIYTIRFITNTTRNPEAFEKIKPYIETILYDCIVPLMFAKQADIDLFRNEPVEFIQKQ